MNANELSVPETIYKYRSYEGINSERNFGTQALTAFKLYASSAKHFNDPFDNAMPFLYTDESFTLDLFTQKYLRDHPLRDKRSHIDLLMDATERYNYIKTYPEKHWRENKDMVNQMDNEFYGILSLTQKSDNLLMWSHYANFHKGYCIGWDAVGLMRFIGNTYQQYGCKIGPVDYRDQYPRLTFQIDPDIGSTIHRCFGKHTCWDYEKEYRVVLNNKADHIITYPKELISEIYLGCNMSGQHREEIKHFLRKEKLSPKLYQMEMSYNRFGLEDSEIAY